MTNSSIVVIYECYYFTIQAIELIFTHDWSKNKEKVTLPLAKNQGMFSSKLSVNGCCKNAQNKIICFTRFQRPVAFPWRQRRRDDVQHPEVRLQLSQRALLQRVRRCQRSHQKPPQRWPGLQVSVGCKFSFFLHISSFAVNVKLPRGEWKVFEFSKGFQICP